MKRGIKTRYFIAAGIILVSILITPYCMKLAYEFRGYRAIGGEYAIVPLGIITAYLYLGIAKAFEKTRIRFKDIWR